MSILASYADFRKQVGNTNQQHSIAFQCSSEGSCLALAFAAVVSADIQLLQCGCISRSSLVYTSLHTVTLGVHGRLKSYDFVYFRLTGCANVYCLIPCTHGSPANHRKRTAVPGA
jgi:hypothetical protein